MKKLTITDKMNYRKKRKKLRNCKFIICCILKTYNRKNLKFSPNNHSDNLKM